MLVVTVEKTVVGGWEENLETQERKEFMGTKNRKSYWSTKKRDKMTSASVVSKPGVMEVTLNRKENSFKDRYKDKIGLPLVAQLVKNPPQCRRPRFDS